MDSEPLHDDPLSQEQAESVVEQEKAIRYWDMCRKKLSELGVAPVLSEPRPAADVAAPQA